MVFLMSIEGAMVKHIGLDEALCGIEEHDAKDGSKDLVVEPLSDPVLVDSNVREPANSVISTIAK